MKNLFNFFLKLFSKRTIETNKSKKTIINPKFPKNIDEFKDLVDDVYKEKRGKYKLLLEFIKSKDILSFEEMKVIYSTLHRSDITDELAEAVCERVKKEKDISTKLSVGNFAFFFERVGFYSIIKLFDYHFIKNGKEPKDSLKLLEEVRRTNCWRHYENESAQRAYIYYFSFGDGKELLNYSMSERFLDIIKGYVSSSKARKMVKERKMSKELFEAIYN